MSKEFWRHWLGEHTREFQLGFNEPRENDGSQENTYKCQKQSKERLPGWEPSQLNMPSSCIKTWLGGRYLEVVLVHRLNLMNVAIVVMWQGRRETRNNLVQPEALHCGPEWRQCHGPERTEVTVGQSLVTLTLPLGKPLQYILGTLLFQSPDSPPHNLRTTSDIFIRPRRPQYWFIGL